VLTAILLVFYLLFVGGRGALVVPLGMMVGVGLLLRRFPPLRRFGAAWAAGAVLGTVGTVLLLMWMVSSLSGD